jgi:dephospho-CoA kinase
VPAPAGVPSTRAGRVYRVGLTGGIGSGKSTVARWLAEEGFLVVDADQLVAQLYRPGGAGAAAVEALFGRQALRADGSVDHRRVADRVFADSGARASLEQAIHPLVRTAFAERLRDAAPGTVAVLEATLLVEAGYRPDFDVVISVEAPEALRIARATARGASEADVRARLTAQGPGDTRRAGADLLLHNDGSLAVLREKVADLAATVRAQAREASA